MDNEKVVDIRPEGGIRFNGFAATLQIIGGVLWLGGLILGIVTGLGLGNVFNYFGGSSFSWGSALTIWVAAFVAGLVPFCFAEIISLLQKIATQHYRVGEEVQLRETVAKEAEKAQMPENTEAKKVQVPTQPVVTEITKSEKTKEESPYLFCPKCGKKVEQQNSIFCAGCGTRLE